MLEHNRIYDIISKGANMRTTLQTGFAAGVLMIVLIYACLGLLLLLSFIGSGVQSLAMHGTGYMRTLAQTERVLAAGTGARASLPAAFFILPMLICGVIGALAALAKREGCRRDKSVLLSNGLLEFSCDYVAWCGSLILLGYAAAFIFLRQKLVWSFFTPNDSLYSLRRPGEGMSSEVSFWLLSLAIIVTALFIGNLLHRAWSFLHYRLLQRFSCFDWREEVRREEKMLSQDSWRSGLPG
jgi:hypothetical protein